jgi:hypothetical protein
MYVAAPEDQLSYQLCFALHSIYMCAGCVCPAERFGDREGGYTRVKSEPVLRRGDGTEMAIIELV